jgi:hypothetical protein
MVLLKVVHRLRNYQHTSRSLTDWCKVLHAPQKFACPPFRNGLTFGIKKYDIAVTFNDGVPTESHKNFLISSKADRATGIPRGDRHTEGR